MRDLQLRSSGNFSIDIPIFISTLLLCTIGVLFIYSSSLTSTGELLSKEYLRQLFWLIPGVILMVGLTIIDYKFFKDVAPYIFIGGILLLLFTLVFGKIVYGGRRWIGIFGLGFQPSEFMKIAYIIMLALLIDRNRVRMNSPVFLSILFAITMIPVALILVQPDLGTSTVFVPIFFFMVFIAGGNIWFLLFLAGAIFSSIFFTILPAWMNYIAQTEMAVITTLQTPQYAVLLASAAFIIAAASALGFFLQRNRLYIIGIFLGVTIGTGILGGLAATRILRDYQMMRLIVFMNPNIDPRGAGWNIIQSLTAVGSGGVSGKGFLLGTHSHYQYIPQQTTDFIFSIIAEEWGFIGSVFLFSMFGLIIVRGTIIMRRAKDGFGAYICAGIITMFFFHFMINIGMAIGMMPITGLPLFFVSYGGSALWTGLIGVGLMQSVYRHRYTF